jgi:uncharacterized protein with GYD domain
MKSTYLCLLNFTEQGLRDLANSPQRGSAFRKQAEANGIKVLAQLWTAGEYDGVLILQAEREEKIFGALAQLAKLGNVRSHSLRAFDEQDFAAMLK